MAKKILVVGATGNVGTATLKVLNEKVGEGVEVYAGVRQPQHAEMLNSLPKIRVTEADMGKPDTVQAAAKGASAVFLVSPGAENRASLIKNALDAVKRVGVPFIVVVSVATVDRTDTIFGKQFTEIEEAVRSSDIDFTILRLPLFIDNNWGNTETIKQESAIYGPADPSKLFCTVAVQDVGKVAANILLDPQKHKNMAYTLCSPPYTHKQLANAFGRSIDRPIDYVQVPYETAKKSFMQKGIPEWQVDGMLELYKIIDSGQYVFDASAIEKVTGDPPMSVDEWVHKVSPAFQ